MPYKIFMVVLILFGFSAIAEPAEKWRFNRVLESDFRHDTEIFPTTITLIRDRDQISLQFKLPNEKVAKTYQVVRAGCKPIETLRSFSDDITPTVQYQIREKADVCEASQMITISLRWEKRERHGRWKLLGIGSYQFRPSSNRNSLLLSVMYQENGSSSSEEASAEYLKP